jgi:hypothetical protein
MTCVTMGSQLLLQGAEFTHPSVPSLRWLAERGGVKKNKRFKTFQINNPLCAQRIEGGRA